ncbi:MAG: LytTR family DNA-binding domain-containing protein [Ginsengibacter sp.]
MLIKCIIIDDEPLARKGLREYIQDVDFLSFCGEFHTPLSASSVLADENIQLIFLDIQMPKLTGIQFLKTLTKAPPVIFTTAFPQHALEGFELNALDYLIKPISFDRFLKAANKAREYYELRQQNMAVNQKPADHFFIKSDNKLVKVLFDDILFVEALQNYVLIHTTSKKYITYLTFHAVQDYLPADLFLKTHKSYIIAISKIDSVEGNDLRVGNNQIPISRNLKDEVMAKLLGDRFLKR